MRNILRSLFEVFQTVAVAVIAVVLVRTFIAQPFLVSGPSMEPTFSNDDYLLVDELTFRFRAPARGEVVVFRYPGDDRSFYIKRIIGLPGETVDVSDGKITITEAGGGVVELAESYAVSDALHDVKNAKLGPEEYFVVGDNRPKSFDSRTWGTLPGDNIVGLVRVRLWPFSSALAFSAPSYE